MAQRALLILVVVGLVAVLVHTLSGVAPDPGANVPGRSNAGASGAGGGPSSLAGVEGDLDPALSTDARSVVATDAAPAREASEAASDRSSPPIVGRLVVLDPELGPRTQESGVLVAYPWRARGPSRPARLQVERGRFDGSLLVHDAYRIGAATMESPSGSRGVLFDDDVFRVPAEGELILEGRYTPRRTLRVLDSATGRDLDRVRVLEVDPRHDPGPLARHPGPWSESRFTETVDGAPSPLVLPAARGVEQYWVTARDHGWARITVDHESEGVTVVRLDLAGSLLVEVTGHEEHVDSGGRCSLVVVDAEGRRTVSATLGTSPDGPARERFLGLPPGPTEVRVASGHPRGATEVVTSTSLVLRPGKEALARINVAPEAFSAKVPVRVEIVGDAAELNAVTGLSVRPADGVVRRGNDVRDVPRGQLERGNGDSVLTRGIDGLSPGPYRFVIAPAMHVARAEVLPRRDEDPHIDDPEREPQTIRVALEEPRTLIVRVVRSPGGAPVPGATVTWAPALEPSLDPPVRGELDLRPGEERASVPLVDGEYVITARAPFHAPRSIAVRIASPREEVVIELEPRAPREVVLMADDRRRPWPEGATCTVRLRGEGAEAATFQADGGELFISTTRSGIHDLELRGIASLERDDAVLEVAVAIEDGRPIEIRVAR